MSAGQNMALSVFKAPGVSDIMLNCGKARSLPCNSNDLLSFTGFASVSTFSCARSSKLSDWSSYQNSPSLSVLSFTSDP